MAKRMRGDRPARDTARDAWLASQGLLVLRYTAADVLANLEGVVEHLIRIAIERQDDLAR
jgi:very-short-patch-repair endonuclease